MVAPPLHSQVSQYEFILGAESRVTDTCVFSRNLYLDLPERTVDLAWILTNFLQLDSLTLKKGFHLDLTTSALQTFAQFPLKSILLHSHPLAFNLDSNDLQWIIDKSPRLERLTLLQDQTSMTSSCQVLSRLTNLGSLKSLDVEINRGLGSLLERKWTNTDATFAKELRRLTIWCLQDFTLDLAEDFETCQQSLRKLFKSWPKLKNVNLNYIDRFSNPPSSTSELLILSHSNVMTSD